MYSPSDAQKGFFLCSKPKASSFSFFHFPHRRPGEHQTFRNAMCVYRPNVQPLFPWLRGAPTECTTACGAASGGGAPGDVKCEYEGGDDVSFQSCDESSKPAPRTCPDPPPCGTSTSIARAEWEGLE